MDIPAARAPGRDPGARPAVRVTVVGDLMLDVYLTGAVTRISPEAPVPVVQVVEERSALGGAANVVANVARLGARCDVIGFVGRDVGGPGVARGRSRRWPAAPCGPCWWSAPTGRRPPRRGCSRGGSRWCASTASATTTSRRTARRSWCDALRASLAEADVLVLEDYNKGVLAPEVIRAALDLAREREIPVVVDPKFRHVFEYRGATVFKPNALEVGRTRWERRSAPATTAGSRRRASASAATTSCSPSARRGWRCAAATGAPSACRRWRARSSTSPARATPSPRASPWRLAAGADVREAAMLANFAAAIEVGKPGVAHGGAGASSARRCGRAPPCEPLRPEEEDACES